MVSKFYLCLQKSCTD